jgi:hypothetical protein
MMRAGSSGRGFELQKYMAARASKRFQVLRSRDVVGRLRYIPGTYRIHLEASCKPQFQPIKTFYSLLFRMLATPTLPDASLSVYSTRSISSQDFTGRQNL